MLADFFFKTIRNSDRPAWVLIDGLDECDEESRIELLAAFTQSRCAGFLILEGFSQRDLLHRQLSAGGGGRQGKPDGRLNL